jgi:hypothetical protein
VVRHDFLCVFGCPSPVRVVFHFVVGVTCQV